MTTNPRKGPSPPDDGVHACREVRLSYGPAQETGEQLIGPAASVRLLSRIIDPYGDRETFAAVYLDARNRPLGWRVVSIGTLTSSLVHPREVFRPGVILGAAAVVVGHNHPSGDPSPSTEDLTVTARLVRAGYLLGIPLLDHLVIGSAEHVSLRERRVDLFTQSS